MTDRKITVREDYFMVRGSKDIPYIKMREKVRRTFDDKSNLLRQEKVDSVSFEVADNWGNKIYMNRDTGNKLYLAFIHGLIKVPTSFGVLESFAVIRAIIEYLDSIGARYSIRKELTADT